MTIEIVFMTSIIILIIAVLLVSAYGIYLTGKKTEDSIKIQLEAARSKQNTHIINMPFKEMTNIIDQLVNFYVMNSVLDLSLTNKSESELSIMMDDVIIDVCTKVKMSMSKHLNEALSFYVSDEYVNKYITNTTRLLLILKSRPKPVVEQSETTTEEK